MTSHSSAARFSKPRNSKHRLGEQGFTLIETTISLVIMMIVGLGAASLFFFAINYNTSAGDRQLAMGVAQKRMEWLRDIPFNAQTRNAAYQAPSIPTANTVGLAATGANGVTESSIESGSRKYNVVTTITDLTFDPDGNPTLKRITITVTPLGAGNTLGSVVLTSIRATTRMGTYS
ncbi:MAG: prepilin-type N-terminal cleavage/methylation domain-containing protein [Acidobacteria bacterium]|nr:prepilin-type N-terminal cleavage/methylation domain-containing protein [Acidobacteriota bacterium]